MISGTRDGAPAPFPESDESRTAIYPADTGEKWVPRIALYSQGMVGFGHIRRNASIAQALRNSALQPSIMLIAEAWQAGGLVLPAGVDCVTLPALRREPDGGYNARFLPDVPEEDILTLRTRVIREAMDVFEPDVLIVDYLPLGVAGELATTLARMRKRGHTRCVLGLRDVLYDPETVRRTWANAENLDAIRDFYDVVWIYGDPTVFDPVREYGLSEVIDGKARYTGYLDQRPRLESAKAESGSMIDNVPSGKLVLCIVGGGHDGRGLAEAFLEADLPPQTTGILLAGPLMPWDERAWLHQKAEGVANMRVLDFVRDTTPLIERADRIVSMGGYNTICEALSFGKHALVVPRVNPEPEQWIRAQRLRELGLVELLHPDELSGPAISRWVARDLGPPPDARGRVDMDGLTRIPTFTAELLGLQTSEVSVSS